jgi:hypothetical protein
VKTKTVQIVKPISLLLKCSSLNFRTEMFALNEFSLFSMPYIRPISMAFSDLLPVSIHIENVKQTINKAKLNEI